MVFLVGVGVILYVLKKRRDMSISRSPTQHHATPSIIATSCTRVPSLRYEENMRLRSYAQLGEGAVPDVVQLHGSPVTQL